MHKQLMLESQSMLWNIYHLDKNDKEIKFKPDINRIYYYKKPKTKTHAKEKDS